MAKNRFLAAVAAGLGAMAVIVLQARKRPHPPSAASRAASYSPREDQARIVDEWGEESFPASDPPQSW